MHSSESSTTQSQTSAETVVADLVVVGGGISGLWLMNRLRNEGYSCLLLEKSAIGLGQTLASQGMIHGGIKYTLGGALSRASESIADMPAYWSRCLRGEGEVDLRDAKILSEHFYFWSSEGITSRMSTFFASKAVQGRMEKLPREKFPELLRQPQFSGQVYRLQDIVVDSGSVMQSLLKQLEGQVYSLAGSRTTWERNGNHAQVRIDSAQGTTVLAARQFIFTAGRGNGDLLSALQIDKPRMQLRPLHQVWVKHDLPYDFYGHCLGADTTPRLSISTHASADGRRVWSLGGSLAEAGVEKTPEELIAFAQREVAELMPWLDMSKAEWLSRRIERAEARQRNFLRPDKAFAQSAAGVDNVIVGWPTKLTLAPNLANEVLQLLAARKLPRNANAAPALPLPAAQLAAAPWDRADD